MVWVRLIAIILFITNLLHAEDREKIRIFNQLYQATNEREWNQGMIQFYQWVRAQFQRRDINRNGTLELNEMPEKLRQELKHWDHNKDNIIDGAEFSEFWVENMNQELDEKEKKTTLAPQKEPAKSESTKQPVKINPALSPAEVKKEGKYDWVPQWFKQLDMNADYQLSLYEWLKAKGKISDFDIIDRNKDGLFTLEELKRALKLGFIK